MKAKKEKQIKTSYSMEMTLTISCAQFYFIESWEIPNTSLAENAIATKIDMMEQEGSWY